MRAEVSLGHAVRRRHRHCAEVGGRPCEDDDRHCDRFRSSRTHRVLKKKGENAAAYTQPGAPDLATRVEAAGQRYMQTMQFLYLGGLIDANADIMPEIKRRIRLAGACYDRFKCKLHDMKDAPFMLKVRLLKTCGVWERSSRISTGLVLVRRHACSYVNRNM